MSRLPPAESLHILGTIYLRSGWLVLDPKEPSSLRAVMEPPEKTEAERQFGGPQSGLPPAFVIGQGLSSWLSVGIDFGTVDCRVATFCNGAPHATQPSRFCALIENIFLRKVNEASIVHSLKQCIINDSKVNCGGLLHSSDQLASKFLATLKQAVEEGTSRLLAKAVIAVPVSFTHRQRKVMKDAAEYAGISVLGLINDCTAAALDACFSNDLRNGRYLVISNGASSFEISVVHAQNRLIETKAVRASEDLSGRAVTIALATGVMREFGDLNPERLLISLHQAKEALDTIGATTIDADGSTAAIDREMAAEWLLEWQQQADAIITSVLTDAQVCENELNGIILTGSATKLWLLDDLLTRRFKSVTRYSGNVASGAAIYAGILVRQAKDWVVWDSLPNPVMVAHGDLVRHVIGLNSPLPISGHASLSPAEDGTVTATILQMVADRGVTLQRVASIMIAEELQPSEHGTTVDLTITATADGLLSFTARHKALDVNLTVIVQDLRDEDGEIIQMPEVTLERSVQSFEGSIHYAATLLEWLEKQPKLEGWPQSVKEFLGDIDNGPFPCPYKLLDTPFDSGCKFLAHANMWLSLESARLTPSQHDLDNMLTLSRLQNSVACKSSAQAFKIAEMFFVLLLNYSSRTGNLLVQAECQLMLARVDAGLKRVEQASAAASAYIRLNRRGANSPDSVIDPTCRVFAIGRNHQQIIDFCIGQLRRLDEQNADDLRHVHEAFESMAKAHIAMKDFVLANYCFRRLLSINRRSNDKKLGILAKYSEFLVSIGDRDASAVVSETIMLALAMHLWDDRTVIEWVDSLLGSSRSTSTLQLNNTRPPYKAIWAAGNSDTLLTRILNHVRHLHGAHAIVNHTPSSTHIIYASFSCEIRTTTSGFTIHPPSIENLPDPVAWNAALQSFYTDIVEPIKDITGGAASGIGFPAEGNQT